MVKERYLYLDMLRGITMLLVIYAHILTFLSTQPQAGFIGFCAKFRMPMFFFVSGFLAYSPNITIGLLRKKVTNRVVRQLYPTLLLMIPYSMFLRYNYFDALLCNGKLGYWFTLALFELYAVYMLTAYVLGKYKVGGVALSIIAILLCDCFVFYIVKFCPSFNWDSAVCQLFSFESIYTIIQYFFWGILARISFDYIKRYIFRPMTMLSILVLYLLCYYLPSWHWIFSVQLLLLIIIYPFYIGGNNMASTKVGLVLSFFGRNTLQIYLLHYFIIFTLRKWYIIPYFVNWCCQRWYVEIVLMIICSIFIASVCMLIDKLLELLKIKHFIFPSRIPHVLKQRLYIE